MRSDFDDHLDNYGEPGMGVTVPRLMDATEAIRWILGVPVRPMSAAEKRDERDRQLISDAQDMAADIVDIDRSVAGMLTDLASALERRMDE